MHIDIVRKDGKISLENFNCDCANKHRIPDMDIYIKSGLINESANCIKQSGFGNNVLIVADENTYSVAAKTIKTVLTDAGMQCRICILRGEKIEPDTKTAEQIHDNLCSETDFLLSVGSGVITDLTRYAAYVSGLPFAVFGTAASMDGYTSVTSSMLIDGMKISKLCKPAKLLMFDPAVLASAPLSMQAAGVGDMLAKYNVLVDWKLGSVVSGEVFCPLCEKLLHTALDLCVANMIGISKRTERGMEALIESLILAGLTGLILGGTRPVSSIDHNISHYWEMMKLACGGNAPSHGISVGIGLIYALLFHETLRNANLTAIDKEKVKERKMTKQEKRAFLADQYPLGIGDMITRENEEWYLAWPEHEKRMDALIAYHDQYRKDCEILPDYTTIIKYMSLFDAPTSATKAGIDKDRLKKTLTCTKDYRSRYNIGKALSELGLLEGSIQKIMAMEDEL